MTANLLCQPKHHLVCRFKSVPLIQRFAKLRRMQCHDLNPTRPSILNRHLQQCKRQSSPPMFRLDIEVQQISSLGLRIHPVRRKLHQPGSRTRHHTALLFHHPPHVAAVAQPRPHPQDEVCHHRPHQLRVRLAGIDKHLPALLRDQLCIRLCRHSRCKHPRSISRRPATIRTMPPLPLNREHIRPGDRLCAAVSGGADSVALLLTLHAANTALREALGVGLSAIHVHHGLRGADADADLDFVQSLCIRLDIPLHIHHASVPDRVQQTGESTEEAARALRYAFFNTLLASGQADAILTAHTLDDQAETVLLKLLRGAWTEGLGAIHPVVLVKTGKILRPFLSARRSQIEAFLQQQNQPWREDGSNADLAYTRNRVRHQLIPLLREFNPLIDETLANVSELARDDDAHWQRAITQLLPQLLLPGKPVRGGGRAVSTAPGQQAVAIELERLRSLDLATRRRVLRGAARQLGARLSFDETASLVAMCATPPGPASLDLPYGLRAQRSARELQLFRSR
jgi:tRNA(Ile)-lysidine synthase